MREDFLHYLWKYKKFDTSDLYTCNHEPVMIINSGHYHQLSGPDFFNAQLIIGQQKWAGNVEIHLKSSDWYLHHHENDEAYENVILHVVWEHDADIFRQNNTEIPVLELKHFIAKETLDHYLLLTSAKSWIFCEKHLQSVDQFILQNWLERLFIERLERKSDGILQLLEQAHCDWEAVLFNLLAKNFGLNTNGEAFRDIASQVPFQIIRKESFQQDNIEALLFGFGSLLEGEKEDVYFNNLRSKFKFLCQKYNLSAAAPIKLEFFKHRPDNFPTIRLAQLAALYHKQQNLFSQVIAARTTKQLRNLFAISTSDYWRTHYQFDRESPPKPKSLSASFIDLLVINTIIPLQFAYARAQGKEITEELIALISTLRPEKNAIIDKFASFDLPSKNAFETQSLLQLKNEYCNRKRCLECAVGMELLKSGP
ncbi:MAG TPA: DUF2851 family protein [Flavobacterium sp.]|jgi:hypothetical protein